MRLRCIRPLAFRPGLVHEIVVGLVFGLPLWIVLTVLACSPDSTPGPVAVADFHKLQLKSGHVLNADPWWMGVPAGHSGYVACRRMWIVVDTGGGGQLRGGRDLIWYEIYAPGDPMLMPDRQVQQVHEMVTFGDVVPWVQATPGNVR